MHEQRAFDLFPSRGLVNWRLQVCIIGPTVRRPALVLARVEGDNFPKICTCKYYARRLKTLRYLISTLLVP
jgi:hypothetical protein